MALPRVFRGTVARKSTLSDGSVMLFIRVNATSGDAVRGYAKVIVSAAVAADFAVGSDYVGSYNVP